MKRYDLNYRFQNKRRLAYILLLTLLSLSQPLLAQTDAAVAGRVISANGDVVAQNSQGDSRQLARRSSIYLGETIVTGPESSTQLRMIDSALVALSESSEFTILEYTYKGDPESDSSTVELLQGGFRTITGAIGEQNRDAYTAVIKGFTTIGIRGTHYEAVIDIDGQIVTGVYDGGTLIANSQGELELGVGADFDFALVVNDTEPPLGLLVQPSTLGNIQLPSFADTEEEDESEDDADNNESTDADQADADQTDADQADTDQADADQAPADAGQAAGDQSQGTDTPASGSDQGAAQASQGNTGGDTSNTAGTFTAPGATVIASTLATTGSSGVTDSPAQALALEVNTNPNETSGNGAISCSDSSAGCEVLDDILKDDNSSYLDAVSLTDDQLSYLLTLGLTADSASGQIDISSLGAAQLSRLRSLARVADNGSTDSGTDSDSGTNSGSDPNDANNFIDAGSLNSAQLDYLSRLGLSPDSSGRIDIGKLSDAQQQELKTLEQSSGTDTGDSTGDDGSLIDASNLNAAQLDYLAKLGLSPDSAGRIDIGKLSDAQQQELKTLEQSTDTDTDNNTGGNSILIDVSTLNAAQLDYLARLGLSPDASGQIDIGALTDSQLQEFKALEPDTDVGSGSNSGGSFSGDATIYLSASTLSPQELEYLAALNLKPDSSGLINVSSLSDAQVQELKDLGAANRSDSGSSYETYIYLDASTLSSEQLAYLASFGLYPASNGLIDISKLSDSQIDDILDGVEPDSGVYINHDSLNPEQLSYLNSLGLYPDADGEIDVSSLSNAQLDQLGDLGSTTNDTTGSTGTYFIDASALNAEQLDFLESLGLKANADGKIDIASLSASEHQQLTELGSTVGDTTGGTTDDTGTYFIDASALNAEQLSFLQSLGLEPDANGNIDIGSLSASEHQKLTDLGSTIDDTTGGSTDGTVTYFIHVSTLNTEQFNYLDSLGLKQDADGNIDIASLSASQQEQLYALATDYSGDTGSASSTTLMIDLDALSDADRNKFYELGLAPAGTTGVVSVDTSTLTTEQKDFLQLLGYVAPLSLPAKTVEAMSIDWGPWNQTGANHTVVVQTLDNGLVRLLTSNYFADVMPSPVANLTGSHRYETGIESAYIGSGSAGQISSLAAGMDVNFDSGAIANGSLQVLSGDQLWSINFDGLVQSGTVNLSPFNTELFSGTELISEAIDASLNGVFTGINGEAFVGGFDLVDTINAINQVDGLFTIER